MEWGIFFNLLAFLQENTWSLKYFFASCLLKMLCNILSAHETYQSWEALPLAACLLIFNNAWNEKKLFKLMMKKLLFWKIAEHDQWSQARGLRPFDGSLLPSLTSLKSVATKQLWGRNLDFWHENTNNNYVRTCLNSVKFKPVKSEVKFEESMTSVSRSVFEATIVSLVLRLSEEEALCFFIFGDERHLSSPCIRRASRHRQSDMLLFSRLLSLEV